MDAANSVAKGKNSHPLVRRWAGLLAAAWAVAFAGATAGTVFAQSSDRHAALVADANNGAILHAEQADELRYPASLTKIMTLYLAFEAIEQGRASYATRIKISQEAASQPPTKLDLDPGETIALIDAMKALITKSANDVAVAIGEHFGGTEVRFAKMMTDKARLFGMSRTTFRNASGLPDPGQVTTARDLMKLALRLQDDFPMHYHLFSTRSFSYDGSTYRNHNNLLYRFQGTDGIKTGYTRASGFNLVSSVRRGGRHVIGVVLGGRTAGRRDDAMQLLVSRALVKASAYKTRKTAPVLVAVAKPAQRPVAGAQPTPAAAVPVRVAEAPSAPRPVMVPPRPRATLVRDDAVASGPVSMSAPIPAPIPAVRPAPVREPVSLDNDSQRFSFAPRMADRAGNEVGAGRGAPPSTFQQQASLLSRGIDPPAPSVAARRIDPPSGVRGPMPAIVAEPMQGGFEIQVGAFATSGEADRALSSARATGIEKT